MGALSPGSRGSTGWLEQGISYLLRAIEISKRVGDAQIQALAWGYLGLAYINLGQDEQAVESLEKALHVASRTRSILPLILSGGIMRACGDRGQEDMLVSTFCRIMQALASLEIDEESQAWTLIMKDYADIYTAYAEHYVILDT